MNTLKQISMNMPEDFLTEVDRCTKVAGFKTRTKYIFN